MHSRRKRGLGHGVQCNPYLHVLWGLNKPETGLKLHRCKINFISKSTLENCSAFPCTSLCFIHSSVVVGQHKFSQLHLFAPGWLVDLFFNVIECFQFLCILKIIWISTWIGVFRKNYASSACRSYHLPAAQQIGLIAISSSDCVTVRIQRLILKNVEHISASFSY